MVTHMQLLGDCLTFRATFPNNGGDDFTFLRSKRGNFLGLRILRGVPIGKSTENSASSSAIQPELTIMHALYSFDKCFCCYLLQYNAASAKKHRSLAQAAVA